SQLGQGASDGAPQSLQERTKSAPLAVSGAPASHSRQSTPSASTSRRRRAQDGFDHRLPQPSPLAVRQRFELDDGPDRTKGRPGKSSAPPEVRWDFGRHSQHLGLQRVDNQTDARCHFDQSVDLALGAFSGRGQEGEVVGVAKHAQARFLRRPHQQDRLLRSRSGSNGAADVGILRLALGSKCANEDTRELTLHAGVRQSAIIAPWLLLWWSVELVARSRKSQGRSDRRPSTLTRVTEAQPSVLFTDAEATQPTPPQKLPPPPPAHSFDRPAPPPLTAASSSAAKAAGASARPPMPALLPPAPPIQPSDRPAAVTSVTAAARCADRLAKPSSAAAAVVAFRTSVMSAAISARASAAASATGRGTTWNCKRNISTIAHRRLRSGAAAATGCQVQRAAAARVHEGAPAAAGAAEVPAVAARSTGHDAQSRFGRQVERAGQLNAAATTDGENSDGGDGLSRLSRSEQRWRSSRAQRNDSPAIERLKLRTLAGSRLRKSEARNTRCPAPAVKFHTAPHPFGSDDGHSCTAKQTPPCSTAPDAFRRPDFMRQLCRLSDSPNTDTQWLRVSLSSSSSAGLYCTLTGVEGQAACDQTGLRLSSCTSTGMHFIAASSSMSTGIVPEDEGPLAHDAPLAQNGIAQAMKLTNDVISVNRLTLRQEVEWPYKDKDKDSLAAAVTFAFPTPTGSFTITSDASSFALCASKFFVTVSADSNPNRKRPASDDPSTATAKLKNRRLTDDAVPCIFPNVASYLSKAVPEERQTVCTSAESRRENDIQRCEVEAEELLQKDVISDFHAIVSYDLPDHLRCFFKVISESSVTFFTTRMSGAGNLEIATSLNVGQELLFEVTVGGDKQASFAGDLVADGSLKTFAQLENILARLKNVRLEDCRHGYEEHLLLAQEAVTKAITDLSAKIEVKSDQELDTSIEEAAFAKLNFLVEQLSFSNFRDLHKLHEQELGQPARIAFQLNTRSLNPTNLEKTNVQHAASIFSESTVEAAKFYNFSSGLLALILNMWTIWNVKTTRKAKEKRLPDAAPLVPNDHRLDKLRQFAAFFQRWEDSKLPGLTAPTFLAVKSCCLTLADLSEHLFSRCEGHAAFSRPPDDQGHSPFSIFTGEQPLVPAVTTDDADQRQLSTQLHDLFFPYRLPRTRQQPVHIPPELESCEFMWLRVDRVKQPLEVLVQLLSLSPVWSQAACPSTPVSVQYKPADELLLNDTLSHCVSVLGESESLQSCLMKSGRRNASGAVLQGGVCFAVQLWPSSEPNGCGAVWNFTAGAGHRVFLASDFPKRLPASVRSFSRSIAAGSVSSFSVPLTGCYAIAAQSGSGGSVSSPPSGFSPSVGGSGVQLSGKFQLAANAALSVAAGGSGGNGRDFSGAGGGGGSFVYSSGGGTLYLAAGGGGGATAGVDELTLVGNHSLLGSSGQPSSQSGTNAVKHSDADSGGGSGGTGGNGGTHDAGSKNYNGGCGAGWLGKSVSASGSGSDGRHGGGLSEGWIGGAGGSSAGIGGRAEAPAASAAEEEAAVLEVYWPHCCGGGGYSGGGAGLSKLWAGGGGGSFCGGVGCVASASVNSTDGWASVTLVSVEGCVV
uniref:Protein kinase domain-containing protein n=1 Tax=Macrostomum lignano TaxID=282301 RepID=A0A1I8FUX3_9PLAT